MTKDSTQLDMFSLEGEKEEKKKREAVSLEQRLSISKHTLIYFILGILILVVIVYIAGVERGRNWKVNKIYRDYIQSQKAGQE